MNKCKNLKQKLNRTIYCNKLKRIIKPGECSGCKFKKFISREIIKKHPIKPTKRTKELSITKKVKLIVWERDHHKCIFCRKAVSWNMANSHYIKRSHGGKGIEQNVMTNCLECHNKYDNSIHRENMMEYAKKYLSSKYDNWNEEDLVYKKIKVINKFCG